MPSGPLIGAQIIVDAVSSVSPTRILDLGTGTGKWGFLLREQLEFAVNRIDRADWRITIDGVEGCPQYVGDHQRAVYNEIYVDDVLRFLRSYAGPHYDVVLALDLIEHFEPEDAVEMVSRALDVSTYAIIATPKGYYPQEGHENALERHMSWWPKTALRKLADITNASLHVVQPPMITIAMFSREAPIPPIRSYVSMTLLAALKQRLVPDGLYYRALGKAGPTIL